MREEAVDFLQLCSQFLNTRGGTEADLLCNRVIVDAAVQVDRVDKNATVKEGRKMEDVTRRSNTNRYTKLSCACEGPGYFSRCLGNVYLSRKALNLVSSRIHSSALLV